MVVQDQACNIWQCGEVKGKICGTGILSKRGSRLQENFCSYFQILFYLSSDNYCFRDGVEDSPDGCEDSIPQRRYWERGKCSTSTGIWGTWQRVACMQDLRYRCQGQVLQDRQLLQRMGFTKSEADFNLYFILVGSLPLISVLCVEDSILTRAEKWLLSANQTWQQNLRWQTLG